MYSWPSASAEEGGPDTEPGASDYPTLGISIHQYLGILLAKVGTILARWFPGLLGGLNK